jgi:hypothetical protein
MVDSDEKRAIHLLYSAVHQAHKQAPSMFTVQQCNVILTAIMSGQAHSWRVVGITPAALDQFAAAGFHSRSGQGITRAHLQPRIETVRKLLLPDEPLSEENFFETWLAADRTILCAKGENKHSPPECIPVENEDGTLFSCKRVVGWHHRNKEREFLRKLFESRG